MIGKESMIYCTGSSNCAQSIPDQISASAWKAGTRRVAVNVNSLVSMNMWGLTPEFLDVLEEGFKEFFEKEVPSNP